MEKNSYQFTEGQIFESFEKVKKYFMNFCKYQPFVVRTHNTKQLSYICRHGIQRKSKSQGIRPNQRYNFKGCTAKINLYKNKRGEWKVTQVSLNHNHDLVDRDNKNLKLKKSEAKDKSEIDSDENMDVLNASENNECVNYVHWSEIKKFKTAFDAIKNLADVLSECHTEEFLNYMQELNIVKNNIRQRLPIFNNSKNNQKPNQKENLPEINIIYPEEMSVPLCDVIIN